MKIGIDISQIAHEGTGVAQYVRSMVTEIARCDVQNEYVLFGASLRKRGVFYSFFDTLNKQSYVRLVVLPIPPTLLVILWNWLHWFPIEWFIGPVDIFWSSDWTQPPLSKARGVTTIHDVSFFKFPESFTSMIVQEQKRRLNWAQRECVQFLCDSYATQDDVMHYLHIPKTKLPVVYPGL